MEVILLENVRNLGPFGSKVKVAAGYGRNFLIPQGKALPATQENLMNFEAQRAELAKKAEDRLVGAQQRGTELEGFVLEIEARASDEGRLYGSIGVAEIIEHFKKASHELIKQEVCLPNGPLKEIGEHQIQLQLHSEVVVDITVQIQASKAAA